ncbi:hypothetical protein D3C78_1839820 [compost metagenome]
MLLAHIAAAAQLGEQTVRGAQRHVQFGGQAGDGFAFGVNGQVFQDFETAFKDIAHAVRLSSGGQTGAIC